jgi:NAD(P)-dependent dehydrogenase (short-subunit alcohol dehydrogenase family)
MGAKGDTKVVLVTGGSTGIGRAAALAFAKQGTKVAIADVAVDSGEETIQRIRKAGGEAFFIPCDVSKVAEVKAMINKTVEVYGCLNWAFNNAGVEGAQLPIGDYPEEICMQVFNTDLMGVWFSMKYEIPQMLKQGGGVIVNMASAAGLIGVPGDSPYTAAKHGVVGMTKAVALEYGKSNIRVNAICPGVTQTEILERVLAKNPEGGKKLVESTPLGRLASPDEIASVAVWLCSDAASFITGHALAVDGGFTAQ